VFVDSNKTACVLARKNAKANKIKKFKAVESELNRLFFMNKNDFNFIELDPFGSPAPYIHFLFYSLRRSKKAHLSITATDTAVLCGAHAKACLKNYGARPLHNEYCHEAGVRVLLGKIARVAAEFDFGIAPLFTLSKQHFFKVILRVDKGAENAFASMKNLGYISHCSKCLNREWSFGVPKRNECANCKSTYEHGGPLWLGGLWEKTFVQKMRALNGERKYENKVKIDALLATIENEMNLPPTYYDLHAVCKKMGRGAVAVEKVVDALNAQGFGSARTHFSPNSIRTGAALAGLERALRQF